MSVASVARVVVPEWAISEFKEFMRNGIPCPGNDPASANPAAPDTYSTSINGMEDFLSRTRQTRLQQEYAAYFRGDLDCVHTKNPITIEACRNLEQAGRTMLGFILAATGAFIFFPEAKGYFFPWVS